MFLKLMMLGIQGVFSILGAERKHGAGAGPVKKKTVLRTIEEQAFNLGLQDDAGACDFADFLQIVDDLVDDVVALLNCFGFLGRKK